MTNIYQNVGEAYIPLTELNLIQEQKSEPYQRLAWKHLEMCINTLINELNIGNVSLIAYKLFQINLLRGRSLFCKSLISAQEALPFITHVYAALVAVCNAKFPIIGELLIKRLIVQFKQSFKHKDKRTCLNTLKFIAHLFNQKMIKQELLFEISHFLLENLKYDFSLEALICFLKECSPKLKVGEIFEILRIMLLRESPVDEKRFKFIIENWILIERNDKFKNHKSILNILDLVKEEDQITHLLHLNDDHDIVDIFDVFMKDVHYQENEDKYESIKDIINDIFLKD